MYLPYCDDSKLFPRDVCFDTLHLTHDQTLGRGKTHSKDRRRLHVGQKIDMLDDVVQPLGQWPVRRKGVWVSGHEMR